MKIQEEVTIKKGKDTYLLFYKEFYKNLIRKNEGQDFIILSGLFLHLTFESLITQLIRSIIEMVFKHTREDITGLWFNIFETEKLNKKLEFFKYTILIKDKEIDKNIKQINKFYIEKLAPLRNKIVHGHEISTTFYHATGERSQSKLSELLTEKNIENLYKEFWENLDIFLNLFNKINVPSNVSLGPDCIKKDIIESTKENLKHIEIDFNKNI